MLESIGKQGAVAFIDGSPQFIHCISHMLIPEPSDEVIQNLILLSSIRILKPDEFADESVNVLKETTWEGKLKTFINFAKTKSHYSESYGSKMIASLITTVKIALYADKYTHSELIRTPVTLFKAQVSSVKDVDEDYGLGKYTKSSVKVHSLVADHYTILSSTELVNHLNLLM